MFDYSPKLYEMILYPTLGGLFAWGIAYNYPSPTTELFSAAMYVNCAFVGSFYLFHEASKYVDANDTRKPANSPKDERPISADPQRIPAMKIGGMVLNSQSVETVNINAVQAFNLNLITQYKGGLPVKMTENYWTKDKPDGERTRWVRIGGTGPTDWKDMMARGLEWGAYKTEGGQEKRVIDSIRKVSQLAAGYPLPTWEQLEYMRKSLVR